MEELKKSDAMIYAMKAVLEEGYRDDLDLLGMVFTLNYLLKEYKMAIHWEKEMDKLKDELKEYKMASHLEKEIDKLKEEEDHD